MTASEGESRANRPDAPPTTDEVIRFYKGLPEIQPPSDRWLQVQNDWIHKFLTCESLVSDPCRGRSCLNLGSGGLSYNLSETSLVHVDLDTTRFQAGQVVIKADIQNLPSSLRDFESCICVGSVINHCDAAQVISNAAKALRPQGTFILEFDSSSSFSLLFTGSFKGSAAIVHTFYQQHRIKLWVYSEDYISAVLKAHGFKIYRRSTCHHISPLAYLVCRNSNLAASLHVFDRVAQSLPYMRRCCANIIFACQKID